MEIEWILISYFCFWHVLKFDLLATRSNESEMQTPLARWAK